jgi:hypothetical protein
MKWTSALLFCTLSASGIASAGTVTSVQASAPSVATGAALSVTVGGTNPCGAAHINYGDGTAITYAITGLPTTQTHTFEKPGTYAIVARGMGNCDGEATTKVDVKGPAAPAPPPPPAPPSASAITGITFTPAPGAIRQPVAINVAGHGACAFTVNFGDGNQQDVSGALPQRVNHTYAVAKTYTVIVAPASPCTGKFTERLQVATRGGERITTLTIDPTPADVGRGVTIVVDGVGTCTYRIDYGDGNREERSKPLPDRLHHVYNAAAAYVVAVEAVGPCEGRTQRTLTVR